MVPKQFWKYSMYAPGLRLLIGVLSGAFAGLHLPVAAANIHVIVFAALVLALAVAAWNKISAGYWIATLAIGLWLSTEIPSRKFVSASKTVPPVPALFRGEIVSVIRTDSLNTRLIAEGELDAKCFDAFHSRVLLSIFHKPGQAEQFLPGQKFSAGMKVRIPRRKILPTDFDEAAYCLSQDVQFLTELNAEALVFHGRRTPHRLIRYDITNAIRKKIELLFSPAYQGMALALVTGDKTKILPEQKQKFSLTGTAHVLVVSGLHVGIIAGFIYVLLGFVRSPQLKFLIFVAALAGFIIVTGFQASAMRAGLMAALFAYAKILQRRVSPLNIVLLASCLLLILFPKFWSSVGFHMSVAAIGGIVLLYSRVRNFFQTFLRFPAFIANPFALTFSASLFVSPIVAYYFGTFSLVSPLANFFVVPLISLAMLSTMLSLVAPVGTFAPRAYAEFAEFLFRSAETINEAALSIPAASVSSENIFPWSILISLALLYLFFSQSRAQLIFRTSAASIAAVLFAGLQTGPDNFQAAIIPRENFVAAVIPVARDTRLVLLMDRRKGVPLRADRAFLEHIASFEGTVWICGRGYSSGKNIGLLRKQRSLRVLPSEADLFERILSKFNETRFPQTLELRRL